MPALVPVGLFLWIPGVIQIAEIIYRWVSRNRHVLSLVFGCKDACALLPKRDRSQDSLD
jgi:predicted DCC family thiol-disulfide oxidoreductase YuxK